MTARYVVHMERARARSRALIRLSRAYPAAFRALLHEELHARDVFPHMHDGSAVGPHDHADASGPALERNGVGGHRPPQLLSTTSPGAGPLAAGSVS